MQLFRILFIIISKGIVPGMRDNDDPRSEPMCCSKSIVVNDFVIIQLNEISIDDMISHL